MTESPSGSRNVLPDNKATTLLKTKICEIGGNDKCKHKDQEKYKEIVVQKNHGVAWKAHMHMEMFSGKSKVDNKKPKAMNQPTNQKSQVNNKTPKPIIKAQTNKNQKQTKQKQRDKQTKNNPKSTETNYIIIQRNGECVLP